MSAKRPKVYFVVVASLYFLTLLQRKQCLTLEASSKFSEPLQQLGKRHGICRILQSSSIVEFLAIAGGTIFSLWGILTSLLEQDSSCRHLYTKKNKFNNEKNTEPNGPIFVLGL